MQVAVIIPFRDRGTDPLRKANLTRVLEHWAAADWEVLLATDGRSGDAQFNRSAAYNRGAGATGADVLVFTEADVLIALPQVLAAITLARAEPGLVVPFRLYRALTRQESELVRAHEKGPSLCATEYTMDRGGSVGCVNVMSRDTLDAVGRWDESFQGSWFDDLAAQRAFDVCAGPTRWIEGAVHHLYHLPGYTGDHLTDADRAATKANEERWHRYLAAKTPDQIRALAAGG